MKFEINREEFLTVLTAAAKLTKEKSPMPALGDFYLNAIADTIEVQSTNLEVFFQASLTCTIEEKGACCVNAKRLLAIVKGTSSPTMTAVLSDAGRLNVRCGSSRASIATHKADEFPDMPSIDDIEQETVLASELAKALKSTVYAAAVDDDRMMFNGVHFQIGKCVATDARNLAAVDAPNVPLAALGTWPTGLIKVMLPSLEAHAGDVEVLAGGGWVGLSIGSQFFMGRLADTKFAAWEGIVPPGSAWRCTMNTKELSDAVKRLIAIGDGTGVLESNDHFMEIVTDGAKAGGEERIEDGSFETSESKVAVDLKLFAKMLKAQETDEVELIFNRSSSPILIRGEGCTHLVMPKSLPGDD